jgi:hypothetical protein
MEKGHVIDLRDDLKQAPSIANLLVRPLKRTFDYALDRKMAGLTHNPCIGVKRLPLPNASRGFYQWKIDDVEEFEEQYAIGTRARAAMAVLLYTGARRSDAVRFNDDMVFDGIDGDGKRCRMLTYIPLKGVERKRREGKADHRVDPDPAGATAHPRCHATPERREALGPWPDRPALYQRARLH